MTGFGRVPRRPDHWASAHDRARARAAERIDSVLDPAEATWLDAHLAGCAACRSIAVAYETDRLALRTLRDIPVEAPRDLWARTATAIEREARGGGRATTPSGDRVRRPRVPLGAISGLLVVVLVVGATALRGGWFDTTVITPSGSGAVGVAQGSAAPSLVALATPFTVSAGDVSWVNAGADGQYAFNVSAIKQVCPPDDKPGCAALDDRTAHQLVLANAPKSVIGSPDKGNAIVVSRDASGQDQVLLVVLPTVTPTAAPTSTPTPIPTVSPTPIPTASPVRTIEPSPSIEPSTSPSPSPTSSPVSASGSLEPSASPLPSDSPIPSASPTPTPTTSPEPTASDSPSPTVSPTPVPSLLPTPAPTLAATLAIATGVSVVGESAAFSRDGTWFAFSARPADMTTGSDIYVWHAGDETARKLTTDGATLFASWANDLLVASRPGADIDADGRITATTVVIDPTTGTESPTIRGLWRPVVDPTERYAIGWSGTLQRDPAGSDPRPAQGDLTMTSWQPSASGSATSVKLPDIGGAVADFDVRWDETGAWVAIWVAEPADTTIGRLTLYHLDQASGTLERPKGAPTEQPALPGFSIGAGRLAWATPTGQDAQGSRVQVVAWSGDGVGTVETVPGQDVIVVR